MASHKSIGQLLQDWRAAQKDVQKVAAIFPHAIGATAVLVVKENFRLQGYDDGNTLTKWPKREKATNKRYSSRRGVKGSVYNAANKILEQSGNLRDGVKYQVSGKLVTVGVDTNLLPYAAIHNEGKMGIAWGKHPFRMAERKYMPTRKEGANPKMIKAFQKKITYEIGQAMKIFKK